MVARRFCQDVSGPRDAETQMRATVTNGIAMDTLRTVARAGPEMALQQLRAEVIASSEPSTRLTQLAAFLEPASTPVQDDHCAPRLHVG